MYGIEVEMENTKLTIRISKSRLEKAKIFAKQNNTSLSRLVDEFLGQLPEGNLQGKSPIVNRLIGVLSSKVSISDYKSHLEKKYRG
jgi:hypothetical protein